VNRLELDLSDLHVVVLDPTVFVPAPAQGVLGLQIREDDKALAKILSHLNDTTTAEKIGLERSVLRLMEGGCQLPLGVYCDGETVHVAHSKVSSEAATYSTFSFENKDTLAQTIVNQLQN
jgi:hydroxymethylbilane synthase